MSKQDLENCPFCGGKPHIETTVEAACPPPTFRQHMRASAKPVCGICGATMPAEYSEWVLVTEDTDPKEPSEELDALIAEVKAKAAEKWNARAEGMQDGAPVSVPADAIGPEEE